MVKDIFNLKKEVLSTPVSKFATILSFGTGLISLSCVNRKNLKKKGDEKWKTVLIVYYQNLATMFTRLFWYSSLLCVSV